VKERKLSTIEMTVLGFAWLRGPCTIYAIMKEISSSESSFYKSRAGTAYSVANRLLGFKLLESISDPERSEEKLIRVTESGILALQSWLTPPVPLPDIFHSADLVRLRFFFLGVVDQDKRLAFIDDSIKGLQEFLTRCEQLIPKNEAIGDYFGVLATVSTVLETRARIEWLTMVREWVENPLALNDKWAEIVLASCQSAADKSPS
jgi:DNA-binding PadR family transcriptional regulator